MKKLVLKNGKEVKLGDKLIIHKEVDTSLGKGTITQMIIVNNETLSSLIKAGVLTQMDDAHDTNCSCKQRINNEVPMEIDFYIEKLVSRLKWHPKRVCNHLNNTNLILPAASFSILLREIAVELDKKYKDSIENSPEIYVISMFNGEIVKADKTHIKNYKNFAAFRTLDDAKIAYKILQPIIEDMFKK